RRAGRHRGGQAAAPRPASLPARSEEPMSDNRAAAAPLVVDLGRKKDKQIKKLRKGDGRLMDDVFELLERLRTGGQLGASAPPVVLVVKQKPRRPRGPFAALR